MIAGHQVIGISRDYDNYLSYFSFIHGTNIYDVLAYRFEPGFGLLAHLLSNANLTGAEMYAAIAGACILIKVYALGESKNYWAALLLFIGFYLLRYYTLFEMTVLRASLALSLSFFVFLRRNTTKIKVSDIAILSVALSMHYSAVIFLPIYLYTPNNRLKAVAIAFLIFIAVFSTKTIAIEILPEFIFVIGTYENLTASSLLPKPMLIDIAFLCFMMYRWNHDDLQMRTATYGILVSLALHFSLLEYSVFASRFRELLSMFFLIYVVRAVSQKINITRFAALLFSIASAATHLYTAYVYDPLLT